jgi:hypothetical protein
MNHEDTKYTRQNREADKPMVCQGDCEASHNFRMNPRVSFVFFVVNRFRSKRG